MAEKDDNLSRQTSNEPPNEGLLSNAQLKEQTHDSPSAANKEETKEPLQNSMTGKSKPFASIFKSLSSASGSSKSNGLGGKYHGEMK